MLKLEEKDAAPKVVFTSISSEKTQHTTKTKKHSDGYLDRAATTPENPKQLILKSLTLHSGSYYLAPHSHGLDKDTMKTENASLHGLRCPGMKAVGQLELKPRTTRAES